MSGLPPEPPQLAQVPGHQQHAGKVRLALSPMVNHWWQTTLYVSARGLTPSPIPYGPEVFQIDFDFLAHRPLITTSTGAEEAFALVPMGLADFYHQVMAPLGALGIDLAVTRFSGRRAPPARSDGSTT